MRRAPQLGQKPHSGVLGRSAGCAGRADPIPAQQRRRHSDDPDSGKTGPVHTLNDDGRGLTLEVFLEDPEYLCDGFSGTLNWDYTPDFENCRYDCDPEVATRFTLP